MEIHPLLATGSKGIDIRRFNIGVAIAAKITITEIVGKDDDKIRTGR
jgi:hypothetical protein